MIFCEIQPHANFPILTKNWLILITSTEPECELYSMELMVRFVANNMSQSKDKSSFRRAVLRSCRSLGF